MAQPNQPQQNQLKTLNGVVKQVLSGDSIVIRGPSKGGAPPEKQINLAYVIAPKMGRRANQTQEDVKDEPYAWESREFLRKEVIGKDVHCVCEYTVSDRWFAVVHLGRDSNGQNMNEAVIAEGLAEVKKSQSASSLQQKLSLLEDHAKSSGKGKWGPNPPSAHVRNVTSTIENPKNFVDSFHQKKIPAIIEYVKDGSTVRVTLLPDFYSIMIMMSGIRCPGFKDNIPEPYAAEAKYHTECRLLHQEVEVCLESVSGLNFLGTIFHPKGNIAEFLVREGYARCVDWSIPFVTSGPEKLRAAEKHAKEKRLRLWKEYTPSAITIDEKDKTFEGKVVEVINADALGIKLADGSIKKIFLSSVRPPRRPETNPDQENQKEKSRNFRQLYDIPYMFEAREFLRKKLIGRKVQVSVDYIQPATASQQPAMTLPEKTCCTVIFSNVNIAESLIGKGLATVVRYKQEDDRRSASFDNLLAAETKAQKDEKGLHSRKETSIHRVVDLAGDPGKSKQFFPSLERAGKMEALVEFVASGSRLRLYISRHNCLITFLLAGISCPRASRQAMGSGVATPGEPWGDEALAFTKALCLQREVEIKVEATDKAGNFIGWLWIDGANLSITLVAEGLSRVHFTGEKSEHGKDLQAKQKIVRDRREKIWSDYEEPKDSDEIKEEINRERKVNYKKGFITEIKPDLNFYIQYEEDGPKVEELMNKLRQELVETPPLPGSYVPRRGDLCAALFSDGLWYRAKVQKVTGNSVSILYLDYGNREETDATKLAVLPSSYHGPPAAHETALACIKPPPDVEILAEARNSFHHDTNNRPVKANVEYRKEGVDYVTLMTEDNEDIVKGLISDGLLMIEDRREKRYEKFLKDYTAAMETAKKERLNLWQYGDFTDDDAKEFGFP